jgi:hypothetical protein
LDPLKLRFASKLSNAEDTDEQERLQRNLLTVGALKSRLFAVIERLDKAPRGEDWGAWLDWPEDLAKYGVRDTY